MSRKQVWWVAAAIASIALAAGFTLAARHFSTGWRRDVRRGILCPDLQ